MKMLELFPKDKREKVIKEGSLDLLVSAFLSIAKDMIERGEDIEQIREELKQLNGSEEESKHHDKDVSIPLSTHNYGFDKP